MVQPGQNSNTYRHVWTVYPSIEFSIGGVFQLENIEYMGMEPEEVHGLA